MQTCYRAEFIEPKKEHYYAHFVTLSGRTLPAQVVDEVLTWTRKHSAHHHIVVEFGENGDHPHVHACIVFDTGKKPSNTKSCLSRTKPIADWIAQNSKHCINVKAMYNADPIMYYLLKENYARIVDSRLPDDLADLNYAWKEKQERDPNAEYSRWKRWYMEMELPLPATEDTVYAMYNDLAFGKNKMKIMPDTRKLKQRCIATAAFINGGESGGIYSGLEKTRCQDNADKRQKIEDKMFKEVQHLTQGPNDLPGFW